MRLTQAVSATHTSAIRQNLDLNRVIPNSCKSPSGVADFVIKPVKAI
jgi:hypothetical protein